MSKGCQPGTAVKSMLAAATLAVVAGSGWPAPARAADVTTGEPAVKLSRSGICHDRTSPNYRQLKYYDGFDSMEQCLAAGGRRPEGAGQRPYEPPPPDPPWWQGIDLSWIAWVAIPLALVAYPVLRRWYYAQRNRRTRRDAEEAARKRWEGHRLDSRGRDRPER